MNALREKIANLTATIEQKFRRGEDFSEQAEARDLARLELRKCLS